MSPPDRPTRCSSGACLHVEEYVRGRIRSRRPADPRVSEAHDDLEERASGTGVRGRSESTPFRGHPGPELTFTLETVEDAQDGAAIVSGCSETEGGAGRSVPNACAEDRTFRAAEGR